jgi:hypothetical protein
VSSRSISGWQQERAELVATLDRLAPAWRELRSALNDLNRLLEP